MSSSQQRRNQIMNEAKLEKLCKSPGDLHYYCDDNRCGANKFYEEGFRNGWRARNLEVLALRERVKTMGQAYDLLQSTIEEKDE